jgi:hypothetical protein
MNQVNIHDRIWRIADGLPLKLGSMTIQTTDSDKLLVTGWIHTRHFENINKSSVQRELEELKEAFTDLTKTYCDLNTIIKKNNLAVEFHLAYDDAGKVGIGLCSELNGELKWYL